MGCPSLEVAILIDLPKNLGNVIIYYYYVDTCAHTEMGELL